MVKQLQPRIQLQGSRLGYGDGISRPDNHDRKRNREFKWRKWYGKARWKKLRIEVLTRDHWTCQATGELLVGKHPTPNSPVVDHIKPHRGDIELFYDINNLQAVSKQWHDGEKQRQERAEGGL